MGAKPRQSLENSSARQDGSCVRIVTEAIRAEAQDRRRHMCSKDHRESLMSQARIKSSQSSANNEDQACRLADHELDAVAGGNTSAPAPNLFKACCNGKHFKEAVLTVR